jgi:hypothetical protein
MMDGAYNVKFKINCDITYLKFIKIDVP